MLFEIRNSVPDVSEPWAEIRDEFLKGNARKAFQSAQELRPTGSLNTANDFVLNIEIARACSRHATSLALIRIANARFPKDSIVQFYQSRSLLTRHLLTDGIAHLHSHQSTLGASHADLWISSLANLYASAGFFKSAKEQLARVKKSPQELCPLTLYTLSCAFEGMLEWEKAIEYAEYCVEAAPRWSRARGYLANCLLARGREGDANKHLEIVQQQGIQESIVELSAAMLPMAQGDFSLACERMSRLLADWPEAEFRKWVQRSLCVLLVEQGDYARAREVRDELGESAALPEELPDAPTDKHKFIPLPLISQNHNQCVPTSVAMALFPQGEVLEPDTIFREMNGREGIQDWQLCQWADEHGIDVVPVRLEKEAVVALVDHDVPLIGTLVNAFSSHVDVVCGYNLDLETVYVRDPQMWAPAAWPWELAFSRYELNGGLMALIPQKDSTKKELAEKFRAPEASALLELSKAVAAGNLEVAEKAHSVIKEDSPCVLFRDGYSVGVVISPRQHSESMKRILNDREFNLIGRFHALLALGMEDAESAVTEFLENDDDGQFRQGGQRYITLLQLMARGEWQSALSIVERLLVRGGGVAKFWEFKSDILAELGDENGSREALELALELQPLRSSLREKKLRREVYSVAFNDFVAQFDALAEDDPNSKHLLLTRASILRNSPDGRAFEEAVEEGLKWFPRQPTLYSQLLDWYVFQGRKDLFDQTYAVAQAMLPGEFPERDEESSEKEQDESLPEKKEDLLRVIWTKPESRRNKALKLLLNMQQEGQLKWYESSALTANQLFFLDSELTAEEQESEIRGLLPDKPPGCIHWYAEHLAGMLTEENCDARTSRIASEWLAKTVPDYRKFPNLWFQHILLLEQGLAKEKAIEELEELVRQHPAMGSAHYRLGVVKYQQQDFPAAKKSFEAALDIEPGLYGAMGMLREVCNVLDDLQGSQECLDRLRECLPYSVGYLREEAERISENSLDKALLFLSENQNDFPADRIELIRVTLYLRGNQLLKAEEILQSHELNQEQDEAYFEDLLGTRIELAIAKEDRDAQSELCDIGLARWPESTRLKVLKSELIHEKDANGARRLLMDVLLKGDGDADVCWRYLILSDQSPDEAAKRVILKAEEDLQPDIAMTFAKLFEETELAPWRGAYLTWARQKYPDYDSFIWRLAFYYHIIGDNKQAVEIAEELHNKNPDNPEAIRTLGRCLIEEDPKRALPLLQQAVASNRSADYLFDLARCQQLVGNRPESQKLHWEVLNSNPYFAASWTNLMFAGESKQKLWPFLEPILRRGLGGTDEYFAVSAVILAKELGKSLPLEWFHVALHRWHALETQPPFADEKTRLSKALVAWKSKRPADVPPNAKLPGGFWASLIARFRWPGRNWIPANQ